MIVGWRNSASGAQPGQADDIALIKTLIACLFCRREDPVEHQKMKDTARQNQEDCRLRQNAGQA